MKLFIALVLASASVCAGQNITTFSMQNASCAPGVAALRVALRNIPYPSNWHFIVVCDDISWTAALRHAGSAAAPGTTYGETFLDQRVSIFRGPYMTVDMLDGYPGYLHITAHEMAHAVLMTPDESKAESQARDWLR